MNELYWITRCDGLLGTIVVLIVISLVLALIFGVVSFESCIEYNKKLFRKLAVIFGVIGIFFLILQAFIPTTKQALMIYGIGGTIDYIKSNETAKQLPDKAILALDKYLESIDEGTEKKQ